MILDWLYVTAIQLGAQYYLYHIILLYVTTIRLEARDVSSQHLLPLSRRVLSDYTKLISKVLKLYTR